MSLYIRVLNNFYTHRKTLRLKVAIGEAAFWVPPRLWAYAAENQPDGCLEDYSADEIAMLIGYSGDAKVMLQAMLQARYLDENPLRIHDWAEHNGYHHTFADRAKKAAAARWGKEEKPPRPQKEEELTVPDLKGKEASIAASNATSIPSVKRFEKPTTEAMRLHGAKIGLPESECDACFYFYESKGWVVGKSPMKSWTAAMQNWKKGYDEKRFQNGVGNSTTGNRALTGAEQRQVGIPEQPRSLTASQILECQARERAAKKLLAAEAVQP